MSLPTEALPDGLTGAGPEPKLGLADRPAPTLDGLQTLYVAWCRKVPSIMYGSSFISIVHALARCPAMTPQSSSMPGSPMGPGAPAGPATAPCMPCSCRWALMPRGAWAPCTRPLRRHRHTARCWSAVRDLLCRRCLDLARHPAATPRVHAHRRAHPVWGVHCTKRDGTWYIRWRPLHQPEGLDCRLQYLHVSRETFRERHEHSRAWSPFNYEVYARAIRGETVVGVAHGQRVAFDSAGGVSHTPLGRTTACGSSSTNWG